MDQTIQLVPLVCLKCSAPIPAEPGQVAWACGQCGQAMALDTARGLVPIEIYYAVRAGSGAPGRPFWVADGTVALRRTAYKPNSGSTRDAEQFWSTPRRFFIPAYRLDTETFLKTGAALLERPPAFQPGAPFPFEPVVLAMEDLQPVGEFLVMGIEAARKDAIREVAFSLRLSPPSLWVLP